MRNFKILTSLLIVFFILLSSLFNFSKTVSGEEVINHKIAGYGPLGGDFLLPTSAKFDDKYFYIMDTFGISIFDIKSGEFVKELKVSTGQSEFVSQIFEINSFFQILRMMKEPEEDPLGKVEYIPTIDFALDSKGLIYVLGFDGINIYRPETGEILNKIPISIPKEFKEKRVNIVSFKIYKDIAYIFTSSIPIGEEEGKAKIVILKYDIDKRDFSGSIELSGSEEEAFSLIPFDFAISTEEKIVVAGTQLNLGLSIPSIGIYAFENSGKFLCSYPDDDEEEIPSFIPLSLDFQDDTILASGLVTGMMGMPAERTAIVKFKLGNDEEGNYEIKETERIEDENFGFLGIDIFVRDEKIAFLTSGSMSNLLSSRALLISDEEIKKYGKFADSEGQIYGSISFAVSNDGDLYETSILSPYIEVFNKEGKFTKRIEIDTSVVSSMMGVLTLPPIIIDMEIDGDNLYVYNLFPTNISKYSIKDGEWSTLWSDEMMSSDLLYSFPIDMRIYEDNIYLLGLFGNNPKINIFSQKGEIEEEEFTLAEEQYKPEFPPFWIGLCINNDEFQILDGTNKSILIFDRKNKNLKSIVNLSKELAIYTSIDIHPDGGWIITDVSQNSILHYSKDGKIIEKIGESGFVPRKIDKETYQKDPNKFFGLTRAKINNGLIYANDFFNFRYHIISFKEERKTPEIKFDPCEIKLENFSLRENKDLTVKFTIDPLEEDFAINLSSNVQWIELKKTSVNANEGKFDLTIIGDNLEGWKENSGVIAITSPSYPEFKKEIPVKVVAYGIIIEITIDEKEAFIITKLGELKIYELDVPPLIKNGRTFVPLRFFGDAVGAKVDWNDTEKKVTYTKKDKVIILYVDKKIAYINGEKKELDAAPFIKNGRTLVPVRFVSENLDSSVEWNSQERTVRITYPKK